MDLRILDKNLDVIAILDNYKSFIWTDRYYEYGDFELYTAMDPALLDFIKKDYYIEILESEHTMIIEDLTIKSDTEEGNYITIVGRSLESILDRRIIWGQKTIKGNFQNAIKTLLNESIISPSKTERKISNFIFETTDDPYITSLTVEAQYTGDNIYDVIQKLCEQVNVGFKVILNENKQFVFSLYYGSNRSYDQTDNPYVIFSPNFENIINSNYIETKSSLKNVTLVGGEVDENENRKYVTVGNVSGLDRREIFTDARDLQSEVDGKTLSAAEYNNQLTQRGKETLAENIEEIAFEGESDTSIMFKFGEDFFMGDIVQVENEYGHESRARVVEMVISEDEEGYSVYPTFKTETGEEDEA